MSMMLRMAILGEYGVCGSVGHSINMLPILRFRLSISCQDYYIYTNSSHFHSYMKESLDDVQPPKCARVFGRSDGTDNTKIDNNFIEDF